MQQHRLASIGLLACAIWASAASPELTVNFVQPEHYVDAGYTHQYANDADRAEVERDVAGHLKQLAERLPPGETLQVDILNIDLAGDFQPLRFRSGNDVRVMREITWPSMTLRYTLMRDEQVVAHGEERIADMNYLLSINHYGSSDKLRYEKPMLDRWFETRILKR